MSMSLAIAGTLEDGIRAYEQKDYTTAVRLLTPISQRSSYAQLLLGLFYRDGTGVAQNHLEAVRFFKLAVEDADKDAMNALANAYWMGEGVAEDKVRAYAWSLLAAAQGHDLARENVRDIAKIITSEQKADGLKYAQTCRRQNYISCN